MKPRVVFKSNQKVNGGSLPIGGGLRQTAWFAMPGESNIQPVENHAQPTGRTLTAAQELILEGFAETVLKEATRKIKVKKNGGQVGQ